MYKYFITEEKYNRGDLPRKDADMSNKKDKNTKYAPGYTQATPGINNPEIAVPAFNPPVPNRAWTAMKEGKDIDSLTEEEKRDMYFGRDTYF